MYKVKLLNNIADLVHRELPAPDFTLGKELEAPEGVLVRSADMHNTPLWPELLGIARAGAGVNNIPLPECAAAGVVVFNTPGANANAVKELVICTLLLTGRRIVPAINWLAEAPTKGITGIDKVVEKEKNNYVGCELKGKTLGVIGLGAIGSLVANAALTGLGMEVLGYDPFMSVDAAWSLQPGVRHARSIEEVLASSDFVTLHLPLTADTKGMIGAAQLALMKPTAVLLNLARGGLEDADAVLTALAAGKLRCFVTDFPSDKLVGKPGVLALPHLGASTPESEDNCASMAAIQLRRYLVDGDIVNSVNYPRCEMPRSTAFRLCLLHKSDAEFSGALAALGVANLTTRTRGDYGATLADLTAEPAEAELTRLAAISGVVRVRLLK